jgi:hypothetical protein
VHGGDNSCGRDADRKIGGPRLVAQCHTGGMPTFRPRGRPDGNIIAL